jgi:peptidoglycan/LPS O-acetylase OafA/YrhL
MVVLFHLQAPLFGNGFLGVDVFFVISGFLMAKLYDRGSALDFYKKRIDRLLPAYSMTVVAVLVAGCLLLIPTDFSQLLEQAIASAFFANNIAFWNQNSYFDKAAFNPLLNFWSLSVEVQFYLIVPFIYPFLRKHRWLLITTLLLSLAACVVVQTVSPKTSFFWLPFRVWEFLIGAYVAWNPRDDGADSNNPRLAYVALGLLIASLLVMPLKPDHRGIFTGHPSAAAAWVAFLTGALIHLRLPQRALATTLGKATAKLGDYSYSIYLVHFPAIVLWNYLEFGGTILAQTSLQKSLATLLTIVVAATLSYRYGERGFRHFFATRAFRVMAPIGLVLAAFATASLNEHRFNDSDRNIFSAWTDRSPYRCGKAFRVLHPTKEICQLGDLKHPNSVLLIGNSHADSIKVSFAAAAEQNGLDTYFVVANDPLTGNKVSAAKLVEEAQALGIRFMAVHFSNIYPNAAHREHVRKLIELSAQNGMKTLLLAPVPTYPVHVPQSMYLSQGQANKLALDRAAFSAKTKDFQTLVESVKVFGIATADPAVTLCPSDGTCLFADPTKHPYYFDSNHLTLTGARLLEPLLSKGLHDVQLGI